MVTYSINWMGPLHMSWYENRGLVKDGEIITLFSGGRIDVYGLGDEYPYGSEIGVPSMIGEDWESFADWLDDFSTDTQWTLDQLLEEYEKTNPKVRFYDPR